jgi:predicted ATPase
MLLVLDNFEHVTTAAPIVAGLLAQSPGSKALVTSRAPLRLRGEQEIPVAPLPLPEASASAEVSLDALARSEAVQLFVARAQTVRPDFSLTAETAAVIAEICRRLDGLPLAIELAAARVRILSPRDLLARLDDQLRVLTGGPRDAPTRQQTLRQTIAWSHDLLSPHEQALFRHIAIFANSATLDAVESVAGSDGIDSFDALTALVEESLVQLTDNDPDEARFGMLQSIRAFGLEQLAAHGEEASVREAHARYYASIVQVARPALSGPQQRTWFDRFETEHDDLRAALRWLLDRHDGDAVRLASTLWAFWWIRGHLSEGSRWMQEILALDTTDDPSARALALVGAGTLAEAQGEYDRAASLHEEALTLAHAHGDNLEAARALGGLAAVAQDHGEYELANERFGEALALFREQGDQVGIAQMLLGLGTLAAAQGDYARAAALFEEGGECLGALGDRWGQAHAKANLGWLAFLDADLERATSRTEEALAIFRELGDKPNIALLSANLGEIWHRCGEPTRAAPLFDAGLSLFRELGDRRNIAATLVTLAEMELSQGDLSRAETHLRESLLLAAEIEDQEGMARGLETLAALAAARGAPAQTTHALAAADALRVAIGAPLPAIFRPEREQLQAGARAALGDQVFAAAWTEGRARTAEQIIAATLA